MIVLKTLALRWIIYCDIDKSCFISKFCHRLSQNRPLFTCLDEHTAQKAVPQWFKLNLAVLQVLQNTSLKFSYTI